MIASESSPRSAKGSNRLSGLSTGSHLLVQAGEYVCALPLVSVRRVVRSLTVHPLPGSAPELEGPRQPVWVGRYVSGPRRTTSFQRCQRPAQG